ncbi:MAG: squalene/phytoene synthase family protein [Myxococcales bacterium]|jgi:farnesyl-diphosphate farnesyltransferase|nr:squalene/phytoene synthase family protein [Myxococcales bacterium]
MYDLDDLLERTSRTYALTIPFLPEPTRHEVAIAYLMMRVVDTFEDAETWSTAARCEALDAFGRLIHFEADPDLAETQAFAARLDANPPSSHAGYQELLHELPGLLADLATVGRAQRDRIVLYTQKMIDGMKETLRVSERRDGAIVIESLAELRDYCYFVAGLVGEMLTELMLLDAEQLLPAAASLRAKARLFGEALQLTNILKDSGVDAKEGRSFLKDAARRSEAFELARSDLRTAAEYIDTLQKHGAPVGYLGFTAFPVKLAIATLRQVEAKGPGHKISRDDVARALLELQSALDTNARPVPEIDGI